MDNLVKKFRLTPIFDDGLAVRGEAGSAPGGWAFVDSRTANLRDTAHEIGHCLGLHHPFDSRADVSFLEIIPDAADGTMMGYGEGSRLIRAEWDKINVDP